MIILGKKNWIAGIIMYVELLILQSVFHETVFELGLMIAIGGLTYFVVLVILKDSIICNIGKAIIKKSNLSELSIKIERKDYQ